MFKLSSVSKSFGADPVLTDVSFILNDGERAGLIGPNGAGKSTLMMLIAGLLRPDAGSVWINPADTVAYLPQYPADELHLTVRKSLLRGAGRVGELQARVRDLEQDMSAAAGERLDALIREYAEVRDEFDRLGGYELDARIEQVVEGLELRSPGFDSPVRSLSGGNKTKLSLARLLLSGANILLLDEPTNYLDLASLLWLERFVTEGDRSYLIVSHDRRFLDRTISSIIELKPGTPGVRVWAGGYSEYDDSRLRERQKQFEAYRDQQAEIARIEADIRRTKDQARYTESGTQLDTARRYAKKVARKAKARERRLERQINDSERQVEKPAQQWGLDLDDLGREPIEDDRIVLDVQNLRAGYGGREVLHGASLSVFGRDRLVLLGANGSGKSTLLHCVTGALPYKGVVRITPNVRVGALSQEGDELPLDKTVFEAFRSSTTMYEDEARTYLHKFLFTSEDVFKPVRALSHGRRAKLALAILVLSDANFLILDEPTSHMDVPALEAVEEALAEYKGPLLLVSHDRYFIERVGVNRFEVMEDGVLRPVESMHQYENLGRHDEVSERDSYGD